MTFVARLLSFIGRLCFVLVFVVSGFHHVSNFDAEVESMKAVPFFTITQTVDYLPIILGFAFGLQLLGSLLVVFNIRWGYILLISFLVPVTLIIHNFWETPDNVSHFIDFIKNVSIIGASLALFFTPYSLGRPRSSAPTKTNTKRD